jgi:hypothetical protein
LKEAVLGRLIAAKSIRQLLDILFGVREYYSSSFCNVREEFESFLSIYLFFKKYIRIFK